jgi:hypothetical protein
MVQVFPPKIERIHFAPFDIGSRYMQNVATKASVIINVVRAEIVHLCACENAKKKEQRARGSEEMAWHIPATA